MSHLSDNAVRLVPPSQEPITLAEARRFLRIDVPGYPGDTSQDDLIRSFITGARRAIEDGIDCSIGVQTIMVAAESFTHLANCYTGASTYGIELPYGPIRSIASIKYLTSDGQDLTVNPASYRLTETPPQRIVLRPGFSWPSASMEPDSVRVTYVAGYGPAARGVFDQPDTYADQYADAYSDSNEPNIPATVADRFTIPESLVIALRLLVGHYWIDRNAIIEGHIVAELPLGVQSLLWPNRASIGL